MISWLWWSAYIHHSFILVGTWFSITKAESCSVLIICIDATPQDAYPYMTQSRVFLAEKYKKPHIFMKLYWPVCPQSIS